jgi:hypothetical protein
MKLLLMSEFEQRVDDIISMIQYTYGTQVGLMARYYSQVDSELISTTAAGNRRYSTYVKGYVFGYYMALSKALLNTMEFCYNVDGILYSTGRNGDRPHISKLLNLAKYADLGDYPCGYYWSDTDKCYFRQQSC